MILTTPLLRLLKEREPSCETHFVIKAKYADLIRSNPNVNRVHLVQDEAEVHSLENLRRVLRQERFDTTLDLQNNFRSIYLRRDTSKDIRIIRKDIVKRWLLVNMKLNFYSAIRSVPLKYAQTLDESISEITGTELHIPPQAATKIEHLWKESLSDGRKAIIFCPGARHFTKRWPVDYWEALGKSLASDYSIIILGGTEDKEICMSIARACGGRSLAGDLSLIESAALLGYAEAVVTNDSFLMHAADALGKKVIAIFGSTVKELGFFPSGRATRIIEVNGLSCRPCSHIGREKCPRGHFRCMLESTPEIVGQRLAQLTGR